MYCNIKMSNALVYLQDPTNISYFVVVFSLIVCLYILQSKQSSKDEVAEDIEEEEEEEEEEDDVKEDDIAICGDDDSNVNGDKDKVKFDINKKTWQETPKIYAR